MRSGGSDHRGWGEGAQRRRTFVWRQQPQMDGVPCLSDVVLTGEVYKRDV